MWFWRARTCGFREERLELADKALKRAQRELDLGAMSPLDIYQPQQVYATAEIAVSQAQFSCSRRRMPCASRSAPISTRTSATCPIELTETVLPPADTSAIDAEAASKGRLRTGRT